MRALITGAGGLLAAAVTRELQMTHDVVALGHAELDIADRDAAARAIGAVRPAVVVNCAAYNDVDAAEDQVPLALETNAMAVLALCRAARAASVPLVHYGSDFVFDGTGTRPYREDDPPNPRGVYAASKVLGDWFALEHPRGYVLRVESLFGEPGPGRTRRSSLGTIVDRIRAGAEVAVFTDRTVSPSYTADVARATRLLLERDAAPGLYHCVNSGAATWAEVAAEAARILGLPLRMKPITLDSVTLKAPRPKYCALSNAKLAAAGIRMPAWQDALRQHLDKT
jgi:dTDP-4-dehydrorhamnose reductase